jgi:4a-hydroxytetrahydrobiopterin dehydratase
MSSLASKTCIPCRGGVPPLQGKELESLRQQVPQWNVVNDAHHAFLLQLGTVRLG